MLPMLMSKSYMKKTVNGVYAKQKLSSWNGHIMFKKLKDKPVWPTADGEVLDHPLKIVIWSIKRGGREEKNEVSQIFPHADEKS